MSEVYLYVVWRKDVEDRFFPAMIFQASNDAQFLRYTGLEVGDQVDRYTVIDSKPRRRIRPVQGPFEWSDF